MMWNLLCAMGILMVAGCTGGASDLSDTNNVKPVTLRIAAAADLRVAFEGVKQAFEQAHPGILVDLTFGASGTLLAQIENGAGFDVFLSADEAYAQRLVDRGKVSSKGPFRYARGHLVVWCRRDLGIDISAGLAKLKDERVRRIALADPEHAPYGRAAMLALTHLGLDEAVREKLVFGENVSQAAQFALSGGAEVALIGKSLAMSEAMWSAGEFFEVPDDAYPPLIQAGVILKATQHAEQAELFREFLLGADGQALLREFGFSPPELLP